MKRKNTLVSEQQVIDEQPLFAIEEEDSDEKLSSTISQEEMNELREIGLNDVEIAEILGVDSFSDIIISGLDVNATDVDSIDVSTVVIGKTDNEGLSSIFADEQEHGKSNSLLNVSEKSASTQSNDIDSSFTKECLTRFPKKLDTIKNRDVAFTKDNTIASLPADESINLANDNQHDKEIVVPEYNQEDVAHNVTMLLDDKLIAHEAITHDQLIIDTISETELAEMRSLGLTEEEVVKMIGSLPHQEQTKNNADAVLLSDDAVIDDVNSEAYEDYQDSNEPDSVLVNNTDQKDNNAQTSSGSIHDSLGLDHSEVNELRALDLSDDEICKILGVESIAGVAITVIANHVDEIDNSIKDDKAHSTKDDSKDNPIAVISESTEQESDLFAVDDTNIDADVLNETVIADVSVITDVDTESTSEADIELTEQEELRELGLSDDEICEVLGVASLTGIATTVIANHVDEIDVDVNNESVTETDKELAELRTFGLSDDEICEIFGIAHLSEIFDVNDQTVTESVIAESDSVTVVDAADINTSAAVEDAPISETSLSLAPDLSESIDNIDSVNYSKITTASKEKAVVARLLAYSDNKYLTLPIHNMVELIELPTIITLPASEDYVYGLTAWQNIMIPVIDLHVLMNSNSQNGFVAAASVVVNFIMIVSYQDGTDTNYIAIKADDATDSVMVDNSMACELPVDSHIDWTCYAIACFSYQGQPVPIVEAERLFT